MRDRLTGTHQRRVLRCIGVVALFAVVLGAPETVNAVPPPPAVQDFTCAARPGYVVRCTWAGPDAGSEAGDGTGAEAGDGTVPTGYRVEWRRTGTAGGSGAAETTGATSLTLEHDGPGVYEYRIHAFRRPTSPPLVVRGPSSTWARVTAAPPRFTPSAEVTDSIRVSYGDHAQQSYRAVLPEGADMDRPAVVVLHGGSWVAGEATGPTFKINQLLYDEGIPSFAVDYRLARVAPWPAQRSDVFAAVADIRSRAREYGINPDRITAVGSSAGGHLALWLASFGSGAERVRGAVAFSAPTSIARIRSDRGSVTDAAKLKATTTPRATRDRGSASTGPAPAGAATSAASKAAATAQRKNNHLADMTALLLPGEPVTCGAVCQSVAPQTQASRDDAPALLFAGDSEWVSPLHSYDYADAYASIPEVDVQVRLLANEKRHALAFVYGRPGVWEETLAWLRQHS